ncbi:putative mucin/carbohydrate-binding domain-containing protein [Enterococcus faecalis]|uniref:putative mucin/carbohydrate-binding domain-containing protein n=1 Tax=Enterococcus faecalis TaxID=1351 RepID=UPI001CE037FC|nr:putative mucin/carbohydrate-binding domain-containing protein [Enterococcus faecalis]
MRGLTNIDQQNTEYILGTVINNSEISVVEEPEASIGKPLMVISPEGTRFSAFDFVKESGRSVYSEFPKLIANGGNFEDKSSELRYIEKICMTPEKLTLNTFEQFTKQNIPERKGYTFDKWQFSLPTGSTISTVLDLADKQVTYTASWKRKDGVSSDTGNTVKPHQSDLEISYVPEQFELTEPKVLGITGEKYLQLKNGTHFNVGVRDTTNEQPVNWELTAQLKWNTQSVPGAFIQTYNQSGEVQLNVNDGSTPFNPQTDLEKTSGEVTGNKMIQIKGTAISIMQSTGENRNGIYDYDFGEVKIRIPEIENVPAGTYNGFVEWNLCISPDEDNYLDEDFNIIEQKINSLFSGDKLADTVTKDLLNELQIDLSKFTDSDKKNELQIKLDTAKKLFDENIKRTVKEINITVKPTNNLNAGIHMGNGHDRQDLGMQITKDSTIKIKQINPNYKDRLVLRLLTNDSVTESSISFSNQEVSLKAKDLSVPFIDTPYMSNGNEKPIVEITVEGNKIDLPIFNKQKELDSFIQLWNDTEGYALIQGDRFQILFPNNNKSSVLQKNLIDLISMYDNDIIGFYNNLIGLSDNPDNPLDQSSPRRYFYKANAHGVGAFYYGLNWTAQSSLSASGWLSDGWGVLHETGHGYQGNFMNRGMSVGEVWNNLYGVIYNYEHMGKEIADKNSWLYNYGYKAHYEQSFAQMIERDELNYESLNVREKLILLSNIVDKAKNEGLQNFYKKYRYLASQEGYKADQYMLPDLLVKYLGESNKYNFAPILRRWGLKVEEESELYAKENNYEAVAHIAQVVPNDQLEKAVSELTNNYRLSSVLSLVTNEELKILNLNSTITLNLKNHDLFKGKKLRILNNKSLYKEIVIDSNNITLDNIPNGVYDLELDTTDGYIELPYLFVKDDSTIDVELINYSVQANKSVQSLFEVNTESIKNTIQQKDIDNSKKLVENLPPSKEKDMLLAKLEEAYNQLFEITLSGFTDRKFAVLNVSNGKAILRINGGTPHSYFNDVYASIKIERNSNIIYEKLFIGNVNISSIEEQIDLIEGDKITVTHQESSGNRFLSNHLELKPNNNGVYHYRIKDKKLIYDYLGEAQQSVENLFEDKSLNKIKNTIQQNDIDKNKELVNKLPLSEEKEILLQNLEEAYNQLQEMLFLGLGDWRFASLDIINGTAILRINNGAPHFYFSNSYARITVVRKSAILYDKQFIGNKNILSEKEIIPLQEGDIINISHKESWRFLTNPLELKPNDTGIYKYIFEDNRINILSQ